MTIHHGLKNIFHIILTKEDATSQIDKNFHNQSLVLKYRENSCFIRNIVKKE